MARRRRSRSMRRHASARQSTTVASPARRQRRHFIWRKHDTQTVRPGAAGSPHAAGSRRKFLKAATGAAAAGATLGFPMIAKAQTGPISMRWQSTWPTKDIFHEYALDYAKKVNDMTGGDLKIEVLPAGAVVPAFGLLDAVSQGHARRRPRRARLPLRQAERAGAVGLGPGVRHGRQHAAGLAPLRRRQGAAATSSTLDRRQRRVVPVRSDADAAARLVQEADHQGRGLQGPQVPHRRHLDRPVHGHGRGGQRAAGRRNRAGDGPRPARRGGVQQHDAPTGCSASPTCPRSACCRASTRTPSSSRSCSTRRSTTRCPRRCRRSSPTPSRRRRPTCRGRRSPLLEGLRRAAEEGRQVLQDAGRDPAGAAPTCDKVLARKSADNPIFGRSSTRRRRSPSARSADLRNSNRRATGVQPLLRREEGLTPAAKKPSPRRGNHLIHGGPVRRWFFLARGTRPRDREARAWTMPSTGAYRVDRRGAGCRASCCSSTS